MKITPSALLETKVRKEANGAAEKMRVRFRKSISKPQLTATVTISITRRISII
jgi:hypothetical protein